MKKNKDGYKVSVKVLGKYWTSNGETLEEALSKLKIPNAKGLSVWKVEYDGRVKEKIMMPNITARLFGMSGLAKEIALKQFRTMFV